MSLDQIQQHELYKPLNRVSATYNCDSAELFKQLNDVLSGEQEVMAAQTKAAEDKARADIEAGLRNMSVSEDAVHSDFISLICVFAITDNMVEQMEPLKEHSFPDAPHLLKLGTEHPSEAVRLCTAQMKSQLQDLYSHVTLWQPQLGTTDASFDGEAEEEKLLGNMAKAFLDGQRSQRKLLDGMSRTIEELKDNVRNLEAQSASSIAPESTAPSQTEASSTTSGHAHQPHVEDVSDSLI